MSRSACCALAGDMPANTVAVIISRVAGFIGLPPFWFSLSLNKRDASNVSWAAGKRALDGRDSPQYLRSDYGYLGHLISSDTFHFVNRSFRFLHYVV